MSLPKQPLPPMPMAPRRSLSPPAQRYRPVDEDAPTPTKNETAATFQSLFSVFDSLTQPERFELIEIARLYTELDIHKRKVAVIALRKLAGQ